MNGQAFRLAKFERVVGHVNAFRRAEFRQHFEIAARAAADIENARILDFRLWILDYSLQKTF